MPAAPVIAAVASVVGAGAAVYSGIQQKKEAKEQAARIEQQTAANVELERQNVEEEMKRVAREQEYSQSLARARAGAAGVTGGTTDLYLAAMEDIGKQELDWIQKVGASREKVTQLGGQAAAASTISRGMAGFWGSMGQGISLTGQAATRIGALQ